MLLANKSVTAQCVSREQVKACIGRAEGHKAEGAQRTFPFPDSSLPRLSGQA